MENTKSPARCIASVLQTQYQDWQEDFIFNSFYLPLEVLRDRRYTVAPIRIVTGSQYETLAALAHAGNADSIGLVNDGASRRMLANAQKVGISERTLASGYVILVAKIWYGRLGNKEFV